MAIEKLSMCAPMMKIKINICPTCRISLPIGPASISPQSAKLCTYGYVSLNSPIIQPVYVAMRPRKIMQRIPGTRPRIARAWGRARTPRETFSASMRIPTCHLKTLDMKNVSGICFVPTTCKSCSGRRRPLHCQRHRSRRAAQPGFRDHEHLYLGAEGVNSVRRRASQIKLAAVVLHRLTNCSKHLFLFPLRWPLILEWSQPWIKRRIKKSDCSCEKVAYATGCASCGLRGDRKKWGKVPANR
jgi:hypothetical protein